MRDDRRYAVDRTADQRSAGLRDRDRVLYTTALRRLGGITQVVASTERGVFHTRLTHTLEVAQIAHAVADQLVTIQPDRVRDSGGVDPYVAEAAALAHDLGHPPFGHVAESELDQILSKEMGLDDGFEGNPQTFRIITKLSVRHEEFVGLNLTRATLNAVLKYPWRRDLNDPNRNKKWGAFRSERDELRWAREDGPREGLRSIEAEIMDWADDIAYAVHDMEDFYRAGIIPLDRFLISDEREVEEFLESALARWQAAGINQSYERNDLNNILVSLMQELLWREELTRPFGGRSEQRGALRSVTAKLLRRYILDLPIRIRDEGPGPTPEGRASLVQRDERAEQEVALLKELTWHYVIRNPALASQQRGHRQVIRNLFNVYMDGTGPDRSILPSWAAESLTASLEEAGTADAEKLARARVVCDIICSMTEPQALAMHGRLTGHSVGSVLEPIVQ